MVEIKNDDFQYIARISHGKDSFKMLDVIVARGLPLDRITTTDVWATDTIRGEHPKMVEFKDMGDEYIWRKYHIEVEHLCARNPDGTKKTYEQMFYHVPIRRSQTVQVERERVPAGDDSRIPGPVECVVSGWTQASTRGCRQVSLFKEGLGAKNSSIYGFPVSLRRRGQWCQKLKTRAQTFSESPAARGGKNIVEYLGIAADEPKRFGQLNEHKRAPLVEFGIEEDLCGLHCQYEGILAPSYETSCRDGCWMCHNQGVNSLRQLRKEYPHLWDLLLKWDNDSPVNFKPNGHTVHDYDRRFQMEDEGLLVPDDRRFKWSMLEEEINYRWF